MIELNKVMLVGRLTRDPEFRSTTSGRPVANMRIAVSRRRSFDRESGESQEDTVFVDVTAWEKLAEFSRNYLGKGRLIFVEGRLRQENWKDRETGENRTKISVVADRIQFADPRPEGAPGARPAGGPEEEDYEGNRAGGWNPAPSSTPSPSPGPVRSDTPTEDDLPF